MRRFIISIFSNWISLLLMEYLLREYFQLNWINTGPWQVALTAAIILALFNLLVRPVLMVLCIPLNALTFGLFSIVINAFILYSTAWLVAGFTIQTFFPAAIVLAIVIGISNSILISLLRGE
jgi:putative membrane protein